MKDWTEDFKYENGMYQNICKVCNSQFIGHKRRFVCKECSGQQQVKVEPEVIVKTAEENGIEYEYYQNVIDTQTDAEILKAELQDLLNESKKYKLPSYNDYIDFLSEHAEPNYTIDLTCVERELIYRFFNSRFSE